MSDGPMRLATRGSELALRQAGTVRASLEDRRVETELVEVETTGDRVREELIHRLGKTGAFVRSLDEQVLAGEVDGAVHSMKDVPTEQPEELVVAAVPERGPAADALVTPDGAGLADLPRGAVVGTASMRRRAQLLAERPDLEVRPLRGNVDTRVEKLLAPGLQAEHERRLDAEAAAADTDGDGESEDGDGEPESESEREETAEEWFAGLNELERAALGREVDREYDAIVLAEAGLVRSGLDRRVEYRRLDPTTFVPAPGQGALAVTARDGSDAVDVLHEVLDHPRTRAETTVERTILEAVGGGCVAPIGVYATLRGAHVHTAVQVLGADGEEVLERTRDLPVEAHARAARSFGADLRDAGAADLVAAATEADRDAAARRGEEP